MEDNIKNINTKIPIEKIINNTLNFQPKTECEFNNLLVYNFLKTLLEGQEFIGGNKQNKNVNKILRLWELKHQLI